MIDEIEVVEQVTKVVQLFKQRDMLYETYTSKLFDLIRPNVIAAFEDILQLTSEKIVWSDLQLSLDGEDEEEDILLISFILTYSREEANTFILSSFGFDDTEGDTNVRIIKFGIPLRYIFTSKSSITDFVLSITNSTLTDVDKINAQPDSFEEMFDTSKLSPIQMEQFNLFSKKGTKH